jgi:integrase
MDFVPLRDCAGWRRSSVTLASFHQGRAPRNKGLRYPPDPPTVEEIVAVMRSAGDDSDGLRLRGVITVLCRAGLRISEALALAESDLDRTRGAMLVRQGKGGKRREVGMDRWAWEQLESWLEIRATLPLGALFCVLRGPTRGRPCSPAGIRAQLRNAALNAGVRRRVRAASTATRTRRGDVARRCAAGHHPTAARARRSRDHLRLPARDRQHRDHPRRSRTTRAMIPATSRLAPTR